MNRPKKNKATNPTLREDQQIDERNLVHADESEEISIEERIRLYWIDNKGFISGCVLFLALVIIGINGMRIYKQQSDASIQAAYTKAKAASDLESFAQDNSSRNLGGFAALGLADDFYTDENYEKAIEYYEIALSALENDLLNARAELGLAFSIFKSVGAEKGVAYLQAVAENTNIPKQIRQEAAYHLAIEADVEGDSKAFEKYSRQLTESGVGGPWQQRMQLYQQQR